MLQHVSLEVRPDQVRDCVAFWELLGFTEIEPPPILRRFTWVERDGTHIHLDPARRPGDPGRGAHGGRGARRRGTIAAPARHGFEPQPGSNAWNAPRWFVIDPAGHRVEVMSAPPPS